MEGRASFSGSAFFPFFTGRLLAGSEGQSLTILREYGKMASRTTQC